MGDGTARKACLIENNWFIIRIKQFLPTLVSHRAVFYDKQAESKSFTTPLAEEWHEKGLTFSFSFISSVDFRNFRSREQNPGNTIIIMHLIVCVGRSHSFSAYVQFCKGMHMQAYLQAS